MRVEMVVLEGTADGIEEGSHTGGQTVIDSGVTIINTFFTYIGRDDTGKPMYAFAIAYTEE